MGPGAQVEALDVDPGPLESLCHSLDPNMLLWSLQMGVSTLKGGVGPST